MTEIVANDLQLLGGRDEVEGASRPAGATDNFDQIVPKPGSVAAHSTGITDEDIPF
jgi:hypothetical protein